MPKQYEVEKILDHRTEKGRIEYQIKWVGYPKSDSTWEPQCNLQSCPDILLNYKIAKKLVEPSQKSKGQSSSQKPMPTKTVKFKGVADKPKMKKKPHQTSQDSYEEESPAREDEQQYQSLKRRVAPPSATPSRKKVTRNSTPAIAQQDSEMQEEKTDKMDVEPVEIVSRTNTNKLGDAGEAKLLISSMAQVKGKGFCFHAKENGKKVLLNRDQVISRDPLSLVVFYEKHLKIKN